MKILLKKIILTFLVTSISTQDNVNEILESVFELRQNVYDNSSHRDGRILLTNYNYQDPWYGYEQGTTEETYDFIVVGSGSAGAVIANRLSEVNDWKILLLEVGDEANFLTDIAPIAPLFQFTSYNWNYLMEKQDNMCLGLVDQRMAWPRGRALGGTTIINYMIHVRGNKEDYDRWAAQGNSGWSYQDILKYFLKSEDSRLNAEDEGFHNKGGYLSIQHIPYRSGSVDLFVQAAQEAGHPYVDYNGRTQLGVSYVQATMRNGFRCSSEKAYLRPARSRINLRILTRSRVVKLLMDPETKTVSGVRYVRNRRYHVAKVSKEVVLSAGAFNSPQLLMLSGIGPKDHLEELGIPVIQDLPVGQKMYDHLTFLGLIFKFNKSLVPSTVVSHQEQLYDVGNVLELFTRGTGPVTTLGGVEALAYIKTNISTDSTPYPDMELIFIGGGLHTDRGEFYRKTFRVTDEIYNAVWKPLEDEYAFQVLPMLLHPKSFGYLKLKSKNPYQWPRFYGNYFTDSDNIDVKTFIASIREVQKIMEMPTMRRLGVEQVKTPIPGCQNLVFDTDDYWECALRHITATLHHQVSTCKMGPVSDPDAVVDERLRVHGIKRLRVADTSIIPLPLSAHTSSPTYMIGEKASDIIKEDWL